MADVKISGLPAAAIPLNDTDIVPLVQNNITSQATVSDLTAGRAVSAASLTINSSSSSTALCVTQTGTGNALLVEDSTNPDSTPFAIDASGNIIGGYTATVPGYVGVATRASSTFNAFGVTTAGNGFSAFGYGVATGVQRAGLNFNRSESTSIGSHSLVSLNTNLGQINFSGSDGTDFIPAASIVSSVDGTPGTNDMPGRLVFSTTADGASSPTERLRIKSTGQVRFVPQTEPVTAQAGDVYYDSGTNKLRCYNGTIWNDLF